MTWYVVQYKAGQGNRAFEHLKNQGIDCFFPKVPVETLKGGKRASVLKPLFPGYLFINLELSDAKWSKLRSTRGVVRVVSFSSVPAPLEDDVIQHIRRGINTIAEQGGIQPGQSVGLEEGPFRGINAIFQAYDGEERAIVLINFMQQQQTVKVPVSVLKSGFH